MWQPSWGTLTIAIFHRIFTHPKWLGQFLFFFLFFWGKMFFLFGGGGGFFSHLEIISWTSMQDYDYHMSQEITMPLSPPPLPSSSVFLPFPLNLQMYGHVRFTNIVVITYGAPMSWRGWGTTPIDIKLADGCLSCTCLAIFWSTWLDDGNIEGLQIVGWCSRGVSIDCRLLVVTMNPASLSQSFHLHQLGWPYYISVSVSSSCWEPLIN